MDSGDEAFNNFIEVCDDTLSDYDSNVDIDSDKENSKSVAKSKPSKPAKQTQIDKIVSFMEEHNEHVIEKSVYDSLWCTLVDEINSLGPPTYTFDKWRRVWSQYKYRNKKRLADLFRTTQQDVTSQPDPKRKRLSTDNDRSIQTENALTAQMIKVLEQQDNILKKLEKQGTMIERNGHLLEEISKKIT